MAHSKRAPYTVPAIGPVRKVKPRLPGSFNKVNSIPAKKSAAKLGIKFSKLRKSASSAIGTFEFSVENNNDNNNSNNNNTNTERKKEREEKK
jgi:hypothetical protein